MRWAESKDLSTGPMIKPWSMVQKIEKKNYMKGNKQKYGFLQPALSSLWTNKVSVETIDLEVWNTDGYTLSIEWQFNIQK